MIVYDIASRKTYEGMDMWIRECNDYGAQGIPVAVVANKKDLAGKRSVSETEG